MKPDQDELKSTILEIMRLSGIDLKLGDITTEWLPTPHRRPGSLRSQAVYAFVLGDGCLKVGKAGPNTQARFTSQHYSDKAPSTLAKSIIKERNRMLNLVPPSGRQAFQNLSISSVGAWLEANTSRLHIFLPDSAPACSLSLVESFLQCRLRPIYEGKGA